MSFTKEQKGLLEAKLNPQYVIKPTGSFGPKGDYIEGWHAIAEANRIFGFDGWTSELIALTQVGEPYQNEKRNWIVSYICTMRITAGEVTREDVGYGSGASKQVGDAIESATKEAVTDATKRVLRTFGNVFGLALYDKERRNVGVEQPSQPPPKPKAQSRKTFDDLVAKMRQQDSLTVLDEWRKSTDILAEYATLPSDWKKSFADEVAKHKADLLKAKLEENNLETA